MTNISVIMSVYTEHPDILKHSIESILNQTYKNFEFIIILDAPDNFVNKRILEKYCEIDSRIRLYVNEENFGLTKSLNKAVSFAKGKYIARMDADDIALPKRLELQFRYVLEKKLDICGTYVQTIDEEGKLIQNCVKVPTNPTVIRTCLRINNCVFHPTWFVKKEVYEKNGGYEGKYTEDYEFLLKSVKSGFIIGNIPEVLLKYRMTKHSISRSNLFMQYLSLCYLQKKFYKGLCLSFNEYLSNVYSEKRATKFLQANTLLLNGIQKFHEGKYIHTFIYITKAFFSSSFFTKKIIRYAIQFIMTNHL